ncbi:MAG: PaaI family thioesterase [candidate division Zixibacteria bacterium]|nr:PaaI family thioesterase [candidate division Zixibacteria bacterium]
MDTEADPDSPADVQRLAHPFCVACSDENPDGFHLKFAQIDQRTVEAEFSCQGAYEGYPGRLHGGVIALLIDSAMTNCLFALGSVAITAELNLRYLEPILTACPATVRARQIRTAHGLHYLEAEVIQEGKTKVAATGTFMDVRD